jgi:uncharacterized protein YjdB
MVLCTFAVAGCPADRELANVVDAPSQAIEISISLSPPSSQIAIGGSVTLSAQVTGGTAADRANITWTSSSLGVATVSGSGTSASVRGVGAGSTSIQASVGAKTASASVTVTGGSGTAPGG